MSRYLIVKCLLVGVLVSTVLAAIPTAIDWYSNPSGIFRGESGTNWGFVGDTFYSWFWPLVLFIVPAVTVVTAAVTVTRKR